MCQNFISRHFSNQSAMIVLVNWPRAHLHCGVLQLTGASYLGPDSPWMSPRNETVKLGRRQMTVANSPVQLPSWTWCRKWWNHSWHSSQVTLNQCCFAFIRPRTPLVRIDIMLFRELRATVLFLVVTRRCLTVEQLLYWSDWIYTGRAAQIEAKTKFRFGNIVPNKWTLSGFVQPNSANSMYKDDNKISQQQEVSHMNKMLERVQHFQTSFSVGIQPLS